MDADRRENILNGPKFMSKSLELASKSLVSRSGRL
jgi:hypothetical protein